MLALNSYYISFIFMTLVRFNNHYPEILLFPAVKTPAHCLLLLATPQGTCLTRVKADIRNPLRYLLITG